MLSTLKRLSLVFVIILSLAFFGYLVYTGMGAKTKASVSTDVAGNGEIPASKEGLVAQWNFNETNGDIARSEGSCGKQCDGQLVNFAYTGSQDAALGTGWTAKNKLWSTGSLMFDGVNDLVKVSNINAVPTSGFTWEVWIKPNVLGGAIMSSLDEQGCEDLYLNISGSEIYFNVDGVGCKEQGAGKATTSGAGLVVGQWYHIVGTRSYTENTTKIYVNGVLKALTTATIGSVNRSMYTNIGGIADGLTTSSYFNGTVDAVRIYSRALSEKEIAANFQAQNGATALSTSTPMSKVTGNGEIPVSTDGLVAQWNFNESNGTNLSNSSNTTCGKQCDGQLVNFAYTGSQDAALSTGWTAKNKLWGTGALMFDGVNDVVKVNGTKDLDINGVGSKLTIELWFKPISLSNDWQNLVFKGSSDTEDCHEKDCSNRQYSLWLHKDGFIHFTSTPQGQTWQNGGNTPPGIIKVGEWYYVVATIDSTTGLMQTYINGKLQMNITDYSKVGIRSAGGSLSIGNRPDASVPFNGTIDAVRIYSRALSEKEILANFQARNGEIRISPIEIPKGYTTISDNFDGAGLDTSKWNTWKNPSGTQAVSLNQEGGVFRIKINPNQTVYSDAVIERKEVMTGDFEASVDIKVEQDEGKNNTDSFLYFHSVPWGNIIVLGLRRDATNTRIIANQYFNNNWKTELNNPIQSTEKVTVILKKVNNSIIYNYRLNNGEIKTLGTQDAAFNGNGSFLLISNSWDQFPGVTTTFDNFSAKVNLASTLPTPTPIPQSLTATPVPTGSSGGGAQLLFKLRLPDVSSSVGTVPNVQIEIKNKTETLFDFTTGLQRIQGTDYFSTPAPIEFDIPNGTYTMYVKQLKTVRRSFTVNLTRGKTLDCTQKDLNKYCESLGRPDLAPLYSGDSDGLVDTKINNGVRANSYNVVDSNDLQKVVAGYGATSLPPEPNGDFNLDGKIDVQDLGILGKNFGKRGD